MSIIVKYTLRPNVLGPFQRINIGRAFYKNPAWVDPDLDINNWVQNLQPNTGYDYAIDTGSLVVSVDSPLSSLVEEQVAKLVESYQPLHLARKPKLPLYNPPKFKFRKIPVFVAPSVEKHRSAALTRYLKKKKIAVEYNSAKRKLLDDYERYFAKRMERYKESLRLWTKAARSHRERTRSQLAKISKFENLNPYTNVKFVATGPSSSGLVRLWKGNPKYRTSGYTELRGGWLDIFDVSPLYFNLQRPQDIEALVKDMGKGFTDLIWGYAQKYENKLINRLYSKVENAKVDSLTFLAERKQTVSMFKTIISDLLALAKSKRRFFQMLKGSNVASKVANKHLEASFGIVPLLNDLDTIGTSLAEDPVGFNIKVKAMQRRVPLNIENEAFSIDGFLSVRYMCNFNVLDTLFRKLAQWGLTNPARTAYEVAPWSFVVDWLYPLGDLISSYTALDGLAFEGGTKSITFFGTIKIKNPTSFPEGIFLGTTDWKLPSGEFAVKLKDRRVLTEFPSYRPLSFKNPFSWSHGALSLSLLVQKLKP